jgi:hypothetical protein
LRCICWALACLLVKIRSNTSYALPTLSADISDVELSAGRLLEDAPVLIVTFSAQQINCIRDMSGEIIEGAIDDIRSVYYVWAFVRDLEFEESTPTGGAMTNDDESEQNVGEVGGESEQETAKASNADDKTSKRTDSSKEPPPWKMMEMVIRGAHSTI